MTEVLISMLLMAIMMTGLAALQLGTIRQVMDNKRYEGATRLAEGVLERFRTLDSAALPPAASPPQWVIVNNRDNVAMQGVDVDGVSRGPFTVQVLAEDVGPGRLLTVRVSWLQTSGLDIRLIMQVHDELVLEVREDLVDTARAEVDRLMTGVAELAVPLVVDIGVGNNWDEAH